MCLEISCNHNIMQTLIPEQDWYKEKQFETKEFYDLKIEYTNRKIVSVCFSESTASTGQRALLSLQLSGSISSFVFNLV